MTNKEIFESLKTAKWEQFREGEGHVRTEVDGRTALVSAEGTLYINGQIAIPFGVIPEVDEIVTSALTGIFPRIFSEWLEK